MGIMFPPLLANLGYVIIRSAEHVGHAALSHDANKLIHERKVGSVRTFPSFSPLNRNKPNISYCYLF
jgi:hypothetical protein